MDAVRRPIEVGIHFDLRNPRKWAQDPARLHAFALEMCEEAERLGAHSVWTTEHHLFDDDYISAPLTFLAAAAARTKRVRVGTAIVVAPLHHPVEIAEQAVMVDLISDGRLDLGIGAGYRKPEYDLFGATLRRPFGQTDGRLRELRALFAPGGVRPLPVQDPLPIWMGYQGPQGARRAGLLGAPLLSADGRLWEPYRLGLAEAGHSPSLGRMTGSVQAWVSEDPERDWHVVAPHLAHQLDSYFRHMVEGTQASPPQPVDTDRIRARHHTAGRGGIGYFWCDTPEAVARRIFEFVGDAPTETVLLWASIGGMREDIVAKNIDMICTRLAPLLRDPSWLGT